MTAVKRGNGRAELDVDHELPSAEEISGPESSGSEGGIRPSVVPSPEGEVEKLKAERDALLERLARQQADFENSRKRLQREQQEYREYAVENAIRALVPILDSFDRALKAPLGPEFRSGVELINRQLHDALAKLGVEPISAEGQPFDPNFHEAVQMVETSEVPDNHVLDELQKGYKLRDRLIRPAVVRVAKHPK